MKLGPELCSSVVNMVKHRNLLNENTWQGTYNNNVTSNDEVQHMTNTNTWQQIAGEAQFFVSPLIYDCTFSTHSGKKLNESLAYQEFLASVEEEEAWVNEKQNLLSSEDYGDTLAAVQVRIPSILTVRCSVSTAVISFAAVIHENAFGR